MFGKCLLLTQKLQKVSYLYTKMLKRICLWSKTFEKYLISTENIWKVFEIASRHSKSIKISSKLCRKYRICTQNIWTHRICNQLKKVSNLSSKHSKSIEFLFKLWRPNYSKTMMIVIKTFYKYSIDNLFENGIPHPWFARYLGYTKQSEIMWFLHQKIQKVFDFGSKHLRSIDYICKMFEKYRDCKEESSKISYLKPNYSKSVFFSSNIQEVWNFYPKHSKTTWFQLRTFETYWIDTNIIRKVLYL